MNWKDLKIGYKIGLGFSAMILLAALIGGIYSRPLSIGNFWHFTVAGLAIIKATINNGNLKYSLPAAIIYSIFAILFGLVLFTSPAKK